MTVKLGMVVFLALFAAHSSSAQAASTTAENVSANHWLILHRPYFDFD